MATYANMPIPVKFQESIIKPLRYYFSNYAPDDLKYHKDPKEAKIVIGGINDVNRLSVDMLPRVIVSRGNLQVTSNSIDEGLVSEDYSGVRNGLMDKKTHMMVQGSASIIVDARDEGICEYMASEIATFLFISRHDIARCFGFNSFGSNIHVSECTKRGDRDNNEEFFSATISIPIRAEDVFQLKQDSAILKGLVYEISEK